MTPADPRAFLLGLFGAAVEAVDAAICLPPHLPPPPTGGRTVVIGVGKGAAAMAHVLEQHWQGELAGLVVTRYGHGVPLARIELVEAAHPLPDQAGRDAALRMLALVRGLGPADLVLCLVSGGGSALLSLPAPGISVEHKQQISRALLASGAPISAINCVRKHLSAIKGGRLALACAPARVVTLVVSDVPGDDPAMVASGPTLADATTCADALAVLRKYGVDVAPAVLGHLQSGAAETPKPGDARFAGHAVHVIARAQDALAAAAAYARRHGIAAHILSDRLEGEARELGRAQAALARERQRDAGPCVLISGGETSVTMRGHGKGGRNTEYLLALALALDGAAAVHAIACDTDGIDGSENNAGAICGPDTLERARALGLAPQAMLDENDTYSFFSALGELVVTGPTRTNVNDFRAVLVL
ncbi:MAG: glycerate kinase [Massilia sp.]|nr:glycerate kinase [Massilia sp.]